MSIRATFPGCCASAGETQGSGMFFAGVGARPRDRGEGAPELFGSSRRRSATGSRSAVRRRRADTGGSARYWISAANSAAYGARRSRSSDGLVGLETLQVRGPEREPLLVDLGVVLAQQRPGPDLGSGLGKLHRVLGHGE